MCNFWNFCQWRVGSQADAKAHGPLVNILYAYNFTSACNAVHLKQALNIVKNS